MENSEQCEPTKRENDYARASRRGAKTRTKVDTIGTRKRKEREKNENILKKIFLIWKRKRLL